MIVWDRRLERIRQHGGLGLPGPPSADRQQSHASKTWCGSARSLSSFKTGINHSDPVTSRWVLVSSSLAQRESSIAARKQMAEYSLSDINKCGLGSAAPYVGGRRGETRSLYRAPKWKDTFLTVDMGQRLRLDARVVPPRAVKAAARNSPRASGVLRKFTRGLAETLIEILFVGSVRKRMRAGPGRFT
jgi:hypothetical protein